METSKTNWSAFILIVIFVVIVLGIVAFIFLSGKKKENPSPSQTTAALVAASGEVSITKEGLVPKVISIKKGGTVTWTNKDTSPHQVVSDPHPTHSLLPSLNLDPLAQYETVSFKFEKSGKFTYHDEKNPTNTNYQGEVDVQ